jgi:hypothetical protein
MTPQRDPTSVRITIKDIYLKQLSHDKELEAIREAMEKVAGKVSFAQKLSQVAIGLVLGMGGWLAAHLLARP